MSDRPAAELLALWKGQVLGGDRDMDACVALRLIDDLKVLHRLARAEQALADIEKLANNWHGSGSRIHATEIKAALRATQGGQTWP